MESIAYEGGKGAKREPKSNEVHCFSSFVQRPIISALRRLARES